MGFINSASFSGRCRCFVNSRHGFRYARSPLNFESVVQLRYEGHASFSVIALLSSTVLQTSLGSYWYLIGVFSATRVLSPPPLCAIVQDMPAQFQIDFAPWLVVLFVNDRAGHACTRKAQRPRGGGEKYRVVLVAPRRCVPR